jgi:hypothetical protein
LVTADGDQFALLEVVVNVICPCTKKEAKIITRGKSIFFFITIYFK